MKLFCITLGLFIASFSAAAGEDRGNIQREDKPSEVIAGVVRYVGEHVQQVIVAKGRYVEVTYYENSETETAEGFVRAMDEAELTIHRGSWQKTILRDRIQSLMVCNYPWQLKRARYYIPGKNDEIDEVSRYEGERARQIIVAKGRYVEVAYRKEDGKVEIAEGFVRAMDEAELMIYRGGLRRRIPVDRIDVLMVGDDSNQLQTARRMMDESYRPDTRGGRVFKKLIFGGLAGTGLGYLVLMAENCEDAPAGSYCEYGALAAGGIGYIVGLPIGVLIADPDGGIFGTIAGGVLGGVLGTTLSVQMGHLSPFLICPPVVAITMSEIFRKSSVIKVRQFSMGIVPHRKGNLLAIATLRF